MNVKETINELCSHLEPFQLDKEASKLIDQLDHVWTASELALFTCEHFNTLYYYLGDRLNDIVKDSLSPEIWASYGVLINPEVLPDCKNMELCYLVVADGSVKTVQDKNVNATYYGDVDLTISKGDATVINTRHPVTAKDEAYLYVRGTTVVNSTGPVVLKLLDQSRAVVENAKEVTVGDRAFLESKAGNPIIYASGQAQYVISGGSATINHSQGARGAILNSSNPEGSFKLRYDGEGVILLDAPEINNYLLHRIGGKVALFNAKVGPEVQQRLLDSIVPWRNSANQAIKECLIKPMDITRVKEDLRPFLPTLNEEDIRLFENAKDEHDLCMTISDWIPEMVEKGLTGDFLREHFTSRGLMKGNIFTGDVNYQPHLILNLGPQYHFGDQVVNTIGHDQPFYGYEKTVLIARDNEATVSQNASLFALGASDVTAKGESNAYVSHNTSLYVEDHANALGMNDVFIAACDYAKVTAGDNARVQGHDHAWVELAKNSSAMAYQDCMVVSYGNNKVETHDNAKVAHLTYYDGSNPTVISHNGADSTVKIDSIVELEALKAARNLEQSASQRHTTGIRR